MRGSCILSTLEEVHGVEGLLIGPPTTFQEKLQFLFLVFKLLIDRRKCTKVVIQEVSGRSAYAKGLFFLAKRRKDIVYDIDCVPVQNGQGNSRNAFIFEAQTVLTGNSWLHNSIQSNGGKTYYLPTASVFNDDKSPPENSKLTLGWVADYRLYDTSEDEDPNLSVLEEIVIPVAKATELPLKLELIGIQSPRQRNAVRMALSGFPKIELSMPSDWDETICETVLQKCKNWDLALNPFFNHNFHPENEATWNHYLLSAGVPVLTSWNPEIDHLITHGANGWKCKSIGEFSECIKLFSELCQEKRKCMREKAIKSVESRTVEFTSQRFAEWILGDLI